MTTPDDYTIETTEQLQKNLDRIHLVEHSMVNWKFKFSVEEVLASDEELTILKGWLVTASFERPDTNTGKVGRGYGRPMYIQKSTTSSGVLKTAWLSVKLIVDHELMEAFLVDGQRPFDPHNTIDELISPQLTRKRIPQ